MKKFAAILLVLAICLSMGACSGEETSADPTVKVTDPPITSVTMQPVDIEPETLPVTESETEAPTEAPTEPKTEAPTEAPTEPEIVPATEEEVQATEDNGRDYVVNTNTGKFHYPSCSSVDEIKESNKSHYHGTRDELIEQGYSPCGRCHP